MSLQRCSWHDDSGDSDDEHEQCCLCVVANAVIFVVVPTPFVSFCNAAKLEVILELVRNPHDHIILSLFCATLQVCS